MARRRTVGELRIPVLLGAVAAVVDSVGSAAAGRVVAVPEGVGNFKNQL